MACTQSMKIAGEPRCTVTASEGRSVETDKAVISFNVNFSFSDGSETAVLQRTVVTEVDVLLWDSNEAANEYIISQILAELHVPETHTLHIAFKVLAGIATFVSGTTWWLGFHAVVNVDLLLQPI